jgi:hypothetical protein
MQTTLRENILSTLSHFIKSRPGLEFANYGDVSAYRSELRGITRDRHHAEELLAAIGWRKSITAEKLLNASRGAFSGRLSITATETGGARIEYCAGQYYPTEYRRAVCAVLSSALWDYWRENGADTGDKIRARARAELSRSVANRWFR